MKNKLEAAIDAEVAAFRALTLATIARRRAEIEGPPLDSHPAISRCATVRSSPAATERPDEAASAVEVARQTMETSAWFTYANHRREAEDRQANAGTERNSLPAYGSVFIDDVPSPRARLQPLLRDVGRIDVELSSDSGVRITIASVSRDSQGKRFFPTLEFECSDLLRAMKRCVEWSQEPASKPLSPEEMLAALNHLTPQQTSADSSPPKRQP